VIGIETKYHEVAQKENKPSKDRLPRYRAVHEHSGKFVDGALDRILGTDLQQLWLDHLLGLSMLQATGADWSWVRFVVVYPEPNVSIDRACRRYSELLTDRATFTTSTLQKILTSGVLPSARLFAERYIW
jgi:hypothetical protein